MSTIDRAEKIAEVLSGHQARVWARGEKVRVYLKYPRGYQGGAGGADNGYVECSGDSPRYVGATTADLLADLLAEIKAAIGGAA